jgi:alcohol dehydrogenase
MYGFGAFGGPWGGLLSDLVRVPFADGMLVALPDGLDPAAVASASDNLPDAWRLVAPFLAERPGRTSSSSAAAPAPSRCTPSRSPGRSAPGRVDYLDDDPARLAAADRLGAHALEADPERGSYAIVADGSSRADGLRLALRATEPGGHCSHAGVLFENDVALPMLELYTTGVHLHTGRVAARPAIPAILALAASGRLDPSLVTDRVLPWEEAATALLEPHTKLVFRR